MRAAASESVTSNAICVINERNVDVAPCRSEDVDYDRMQLDFNTKF